MNDIKITNEHIEIPLSSDAADSIVLEALKDTKRLILGSIENDAEYLRQYCADPCIPGFIQENMQNNARYLHAVNTMLEYYGW